MVQTVYEFDLHVRVVTEVNLSRFSGNWYVLIQITTICSAMKMERVTLMVNPHVYSKESRFIAVYGKKSVTSYFNDITLF